MPLRAATLAIIGALGLSIGAPARGATFTVTNTADFGAGSLRQAVTLANASSDASNAIVFSLPANSTIALASPLANVLAPLLLDASTAPGLVIDGPNQVFLRGEFAADLTLRGVDFQNGGVSLSFATFTFDAIRDTEVTGRVFSRDFGVNFVKTGPGTLTVANRFDFLVAGGEGTVAEGTLDVTGVLLIPSLRVAPSATLAGNAAPNGFIASNVTVQGRLAPSTAAGRLTIDGELDFETSSVLDVDLQPTDGDHVDVVIGGTNGVVRVAPGARIEFLAQPSDYLATSTVEVLASASPINGSFVLGTNYAFLDESIDTSNPNAISITLAPNGLSLADFAFTPNQRAVVQHLEAAAPGATGDLATALDAIDRSSVTELTALLDALGGESLTAFATGRQILSERTARALHRRTRDAAWGEGRAFYASHIDAAWPTLTGRGAAPKGFLAVGPDPGGSDVAASGDHTIDHDPVRAGAWLDAFGLVGNLEGDAGEAELDTTLSGGTLGIDAWLAERLLLGLAAGYARSDIDPDDRDADVTGDTVQGALYAGWTDPRGFVSAYGRYAHSFQASTRRIESTQLSRRARARWTAQDYGAGGEAGVTLVSLGSFALQPIAGIDWLRLTEESYTEKGAGALGLDIDPESLESVTGRFGGRLFGRVDMGDAGTLVPELRAFWQREFGDRERVLDARLSGAPGLSAIAVRGPELPRDVLILGVGWGASLSEQVQVLLDYDALLDSERVEHQGNLAVRVRF